MALAGAGREEANAFLKEQQSLIAKQRHHLDEQFKRLQMGVISDRLSITLKVLTMLVGLAVAGVVGIMIWNAAHDDGLVIEAFSVPPDLAARGLTGQVVASELLGNLSDLQAKSTSVRAASSYINNWGDDIKVEIPETGVSVGEFDRFLHAWLGHQTHITGAVYRTANGIAITARAGNDTAPTATGSDADFDQLLQKAAEAIYRTTQPYRFAQYLYAASRSGAVRFKDAVNAQKALIANGSPKDRYWAYNGLVTMYAAQLDFEQSIKAGRAAVVLRPDSAQPYFNLARAEQVAQHDEAALADSETAVRLKRDPDVDEQTWATVRPWIACLAASLHGDYMLANEQCREAERLPDAANTRIQARLLRMSVLAALHDADGLREAYNDLPPSNNALDLAGRAGYEALQELALGHWSVLADNRPVLANGRVALPYGFFFTPRNAPSTLAYAMAVTGDLTGAHTEIDKTPVDCGICLRMRGRIDALDKNWDGANNWFTRAAQYAPSTPFPFTDWGQMMLDKGDYDAAIAKFTTANRKGPHFADPLEGWGEALMAKNQSHLALAKFAEANKYAPNWGRLHLKWGEALYYAGKRDEAKGQFARAAQLDLTPSEKAELAGDLGHV
jgi:tetratricopeptide (TPR) repeat protein